MLRDRVKLNSDRRHWSLEASQCIQRLAAILPIVLRCPNLYGYTGRLIKGKPAKLSPFSWTNELWRHRTLYVGFSLSWPVNRLCGYLFNRFYRLEIHSLMVDIFDPACELLPPGTKEIYLCTVLLPLYTIPSLWPPPPSPPFSTKMYSIYSQVCGWQIQNLQNCFTTPNKNDQ